jgi:hypothetical protein
MQQGYIKIIYSVTLCNHIFLYIFIYLFSPFQAILRPFRFFSKKKLNKCDLKPRAKIQNPTITPSGRKVTQVERRKKKERKTLLKVDT